MVFLLGNDIVCDLFSVKCCVVCIFFNRGFILLILIRLGSLLYKFRIIVLLVLWFMLVCLRELNNFMVILLMVLNWVLLLDNVFMKLVVVCMGLIVCEFEGFIFILNILKILIIIINFNDDLDLRLCMYSKDSII